MLPKQAGKPSKGIIINRSRLAAHVHAHICAYHLNVGQIGNQIMLILTHGLTVMTIVMCATERKGRRDKGDNGG